MRRAIGFEGASAGGACSVGDHDDCPGMMEATAPDSTSPTRWAPKSKAGSVERGDGFDQCRALAQAQGEIEAKRRQDAHADVAVGTRDERVFADCLGWRGRVAAALSRGPERGGGRREAQEPRRGVKDDPRSGQTVGAERGELADGRRRRVFGMIGLDPGVLEPRDVGEGGESLLLQRTDAVSAPAPSCGGGQGWGVARTDADYLVRRRSVVGADGATPLLVPPPQGGRRRGGAIPA